MIFTIKTNDEVAGLDIANALIFAGIEHTLLSKKNDKVTQILTMEKEYFGNWKNRCDVIDLNGNHCPEKVMHVIFDDGTELYLCEKCYQNYREHFSIGTR